MPRRIDYYRDPDAPAANSIVPSVNVAVTNDAGQLLLIRRTRTVEPLFVNDRAMVARVR